MPTWLALSQGQYVTSIAASVGPYKLCKGTCGMQAKKRCCKAYGKASPLHITRRKLLTLACENCAKNTCSIDGTKCIVVMPACSMICSKYCGSWWPCGRAMTNCAPQLNGQKNSHTETSKLNGVFCKTRSSGVIPNCAWPHNKRFTTPVCAFMTPLGMPVEPEV